MVLPNSLPRVSELFYITHINAGETENTTKRTSSLNWPKEAKAQKVTSKFNSCNPFFTILIKPYHLVKGQLVRFQTLNLHYFMQC
jgi:hypothetical protein